MDLAFVGQGDPEMNEKIKETIAVLRQGEELLRSVDDATYRQPVEVVFGGTLGGHFRHCLDHYVSFFDGLPSGRIDYETRVRDAMVETDRQVAIELTETVCERLARMADADGSRTLMIREEGSGADADPRWALSSEAREVEFLLGHTVHHHALASVVCRLLGTDVNEDFGMAPSTLRHRQGGHLCAP